MIKSNLSFNLYVIIGLYFLLLNSCSSEIKDSEVRPNIIVFIADDVSWDDLKCYGNKDVISPNINALASRGIIFKNAYLTTSSCSPSRNSIITGRYPHNTGAAELHTMPPTEMISLPEILKSQGYFTLQAGKFHMGDYAKRGFDEVHDNRKLNGLGGENYWVEAIEKAPTEKPFFMWLASHDAHRGWGKNQFLGTHNPSEINVPNYLIDGPETRLDLVNYYDEITRFDYFIGRVVEKLKEKKIFDNTMIIVMADNGRPFPHSKTRINDQGVKTPFIIHYPKLNVESLFCNSLVSAIDIAPTLSEFAGMNEVDHFQGVSFKNLLIDPSQQFRNYIFAEHNWHDYESYERMVRNNRYMYIKNERPQFAQRGPLDAVNSPSYKELKKAQLNGSITNKQSDIFTVPRQPEELYDLTLDPYQFQNLLLTDKIPVGVYEDLKQKLNEWSEQTGDNLPKNITKDWYLREPLDSSEKGSNGKLKSNKTVNYEIRGEMPGSLNNAIKINAKGPF